MLCMDGHRVLMFRQIQLFQALAVILVGLEMALVWQVLWSDNLCLGREKCKLVLCFDLLIKILQE